MRSVQQDLRYDSNVSRVCLCSSKCSKVCDSCIECAGSDLCAGLIGGLGVTPSGNIGETGAIFESVSTSCRALSCCVGLYLTSFALFNIVRQTPV